MALIDKQMLLREVEERLQEDFPGSDVHRIMAILDDALADYNVTSAPSGGGGTDTDSEDLLRYFLNAKAVEGRSPKTIERYRFVLQHLQKGTKVPYSKMTVYHVRDFCTSEQKRGVAKSTLEGNRQVWSSFFGWLMREGLIKQNPIVNVAPIKQPKVQRKPLSQAEVAMLMQAAWDEEDVRNSAIISFFAATGCRVSELCGLNRCDVNLADQSATVYGKGAKERTVYFDDVAAWYLGLYLEQRTDSLNPLFLSKSHERLTPSGIQCMLKKVAKKAGVENVHPHRFRRTRATSLIDHGMAIQDVAAILGHDKLDTTMKYVFIDSRNVANNYKKYA